MQIVEISGGFVLKQDKTRPHVFWVFKNDEPYLAVNNRQIFFYCSKPDEFPVGIITENLLSDMGTGATP